MNRAHGDLVPGLPPIRKYSPKNAVLSGLATLPQTTSINALLVLPLHARSASISQHWPRTDPVQLSNSRVPSRSVEFLGESDEKPFRPADVAKPIRALIPDYFAYQLCAALAKPGKRLVDVVHGEHDAEVA